MLTGTRRMNQQVPSTKAKEATAVFLESIAALFGRIAFAGPAGASVARAYDHTRAALAGP
jgi:hypothetical protein